MLLLILCRPLVVKKSHLKDLEVRPPLPPGFCVKQKNARSVRLFYIFMLFLCLCKENKAKNDADTVCVYYKYMLEMYCRCFRVIQRDLNVPVLP